MKFMPWRRFALRTTHQAWNTPVVEVQDRVRQALGISHGVRITVHYLEWRPVSGIAGILGTIFIVEFKIDKTQL